MKFEEINSLVGNIPFISKRKARYLYHMIIQDQHEHVLELGIGHGAATCYIAAALDEAGKGTVTSVDLIEPDDDFDPCAEELVASCGLERYVSIIRMKTGYTWFLHNKIRRQTRSNKCEPCYDLCIIDGPKNWTIDGAAFFMVDKLLKKHGKIIFDDYDWTYAEADTRREATDGIVHRSLSEEERSIPHVKQIVDLLVMQHPNYGKITVLDNSDWVIAHKVQADQKAIEFTRTITLEEMMARMVVLLRRLRRDTVIR